MRFGFDTSNLFPAVGFGFSYTLFVKLFSVGKQLRALSGCVNYVALGVMKCGADYAMGDPHLDQCRVGVYQQGMQCIGNNMIPLQRSELPQLLWSATIATYISAVILTELRMRMVLVRNQHQHHQ